MRLGTFLRSIRGLNGDSCRWEGTCCAFLVLSSIPSAPSCAAPDGETIRLRPKTLEILRLLAGNAGRVLSKQQLMEAAWPNVHVGEDSLFQCIREIRTALGDDKRQVVRVISGRGYLFQAEVTGAQVTEAGVTEVAAPGRAGNCARQPARAGRTRHDGGGRNEQ